LEQWVHKLFAHLQENVIKILKKNYVKKNQPIMANEHHTHLQKKIIKKNLRKIMTKKFVD
jgi:hypothetical protein